MLSTIVWLQVAQETRKKIAANLGIPRSSGFDVQGGRVVSDGYTPHDLAHITVEKLQSATGLDISDFYALFEKYVLQLEQGIVVNSENIQEMVDEAKKEEPKVDTLFAVEPTPVKTPNAQYAEPEVKKPRTK